MTDRWLHARMLFVAGVAFVAMGVGGLIGPSVAGYAIVSGGALLSVSFLITPMDDLFRPGTGTQSFFEWARKLGDETCMKVVAAVAEGLWETDGGGADFRAYRLNHASAEGYDHVPFRPIYPWVDGEGII